MNRDTAPEVDPGEIVSDLALEVRRRLATGWYPAELLQSVGRDFTPYGADVILGDLARLETVRPITSDRRWLGPVAVLAKRVVRRLIAWYVRPIAIDQTVLNFNLVRSLADLESRIERLEPVWSRPERAPRAEVGAPSELSRLRAAGVRAAVGRAPHGPVIIAGPAATAVVGELDLLDITARAAAADVLVQLERDAGPLAAVIQLAGLLPMLGPRDLLRSVALAAARLLPGGVLLIDAPQPQSHDASDEAARIDPAYVRWVSAEMARVLCEAAGLRVDGVEEWTQSNPAWYMLVAVSARDPRP